VEKRLFIGIFVPLSELPLLVQNFKNIRILFDKKGFDVKWTKRENLHFTLKFLGTTKHHLVPQIADLLVKIAQRYQTFSLRLKGLGAFPDPHRSRVIWAGVQDKRILNELRNDLEKNLEAFGFQTDAYAFSPHLTLGRMRSPKSCKSLIDPFLRKKFGQFIVKDLVLFESLLQGYFPKYTALAQAPLQKSILNFYKK